MRCGCPRMITRIVVAIGVVVLCFAFASCSDKKEDEKNKPEPIGLVLSGGGAKGAYEVGVWQELQAAGLASHITAISGTSIGAINAAIFATRPDDAERLWIENATDVFGEDWMDWRRYTKWSKVVNWSRVFEEAIAAVPVIVELWHAKGESNKASELNDKANNAWWGNDDYRAEAEKKADNAKKHLLNAASKFSNQIASNQFEATESDSVHKGFVDSSYLSDLIESNLPACWQSNSPTVYATATSKGYEKTAIVWRLNSAPQKLRVDILMASASVPHILDSGKINDKVYLDGYMKDNMPLKPVLGYHPDIKTVIAVYLSNEQKLDKNKREANRLAANSVGVRLVEIVPSEDIDGLFGLGKIRVTPERISKLIQMGRTDAHAVLEKSGLHSVEKPLVIAADLIGEANKENFKVKLRCEKSWLKNVFKVEIPESLLDAAEAKIVLVNGTNEVVRIDENADERMRVSGAGEGDFKVAILTFACSRKMLVNVNSVKFVFEHKYCPIEITYKPQLPSDVHPTGKGGDTIYEPIWLKIAGDERSISEWANLWRNQGEKRI